MTRWRGLARVADVDGQEFMIRRWRSTRAAAEAATRQAGLQRLAERAERRERAAAEAVTAAQGDLTTSVVDLIAQAVASPSVAKLAPRTREAYVYTERQIRALAPDLMRKLPREVDVATVRSFLGAFALAHGSAPAAKAKALLRRALDLAVESTAMHTPVNVVLATRDAIPKTRIGKQRLQTRRVPTEVKEFLAALRADPEAGPLIGSRSKSRHGAAGTADANGLDLADLLCFTFTTGVRIGEATGLRWGDPSTWPTAPGLRTSAATSPGSRARGRSGSRGPSPPLANAAYRCRTTWLSSSRRAPRCSGSSRPMTLTVVAPCSRLHRSTTHGGNLAT